MNITLVFLEYEYVSCMNKEKSILHWQYSFCCQVISSNNKILNWDLRTENIADLDYQNIIHCEAYDEKQFLVKWLYITIIYSPLNLNLFIVII